MIETSIYIGDLTGKKGSRKPVHLKVPGENFYTDVVKVIDNLNCDLIVENVSQGFIIHGTIRGSYSGQCSYGLVELVRDFSTNINELFVEEHPYTVQDQQNDENVYTFKGSEIDIEELLHDSVMVALPLAPVCDHGPENCPICSSEIIPHIAKDQALSDSERDVFGEKDPRWAVLDDLKPKNPDSFNQ